MPYRIQNIQQAAPQPGASYLFDANVWLAVLDPTFQNHYSKPYVDFFDAVHSSRLKPPATIVLPSILLSEVLNRLMNDIYYREYCVYYPRPAAMPKHKHYKEFYRVSPEYKIDFASSCQAIRAYHQNVTLLSDNLNAFTFKTLTKDIPVHLDFNDHLYVLLAKQQSLIIVTGDSDFDVEDVDIITSHPRLLRL